MKRDDFVFSVSFCLAYNLPQPPPPQKKIKDGKMVGFGFRAASSLICGGGEGEGGVFAVLFYYVQVCRSAT